MTHMTLTAVGSDRPGIVAALTGALYDLGCNIEDADSTVVRGVFAITLVVAAPAGLDGPALERAGGAALGPIGATVSVRAIADDAGPPAHATHRMRAHGADRPGIVALLSRLLADRGINMTSFSTHTDDAEVPVATLEAEVHVPPKVDAAELADDLIETATDLGLEVTWERIEQA
jgi:glycine cleavage system transcriptional repressor